VEVGCFSVEEDSYAAVLRGGWRGTVKSKGDFGMGFCEFAGYCLFESLQHLNELVLLKGTSYVFVFLPCTPYYPIKGCDFASFAEGDAIQFLF
jgi:hypothetical protein